MKDQAEERSSPPSGRCGPPPTEPAAADLLAGHHAPRLKGDRGIRRSHRPRGRNPYAIGGGLSTATSPSNSASADALSTCTAPTSSASSVAPPRRSPRQGPRMQAPAGRRPPARPYKSRCKIFPHCGKFFPLCGKTPKTFSIVWKNSACFSTVWKHSFPCVVRPRPDPLCGKPRLASPASPLPAATRAVFLWAILECGDKVPGAAAPLWLFW